MVKRANQQAQPGGTRVTKSGVIRSDVRREDLSFKGSARLGQVSDMVSDADAEQDAWIKVFEPKRPGDAGIGIAKRSDDLFLGQFSLVMASVSSSAVIASEVRLRANELVAQGETARQRAFSGLVSVMRRDQILRFVHSMVIDSHDHRRYTLRIDGVGSARTVDEAIDLTGELYANTLTTLAVGTPQFGFRGLAVPRAAPHDQWSDRARLVMGAVSIVSGGRPGLSQAVSESDVEPVRFPLQPVAAQSFLDNIAAALLSLGDSCEVHIEMRGRCFSDPQLETIARAARRLLDADTRQVKLVGIATNVGAPSADDVASIQRTFLAWLAQPVGVDLNVRIQSKGTIPPSLVRLVGVEVLQGRPFSVGADDNDGKAERGCDLSTFLPYNVQMPPMFPDPLSIDALGYPRHFPTVRFENATEGIVLGDIPAPLADEEVRFGTHDRSQHCYVVGTTGTGKSTLLQSMVLQDIEQGRGVALLDPHGDLYQQVLAAIPSHRRDDVVLVDFTDFEACPGLNFLECRTKNRELERNFITQDLGLIFRRLYGHVPESLGPMFFLYMRNSVALVMEDPDGPSTLLDVPRLFADDRYREYLIAHCKDGAVRDFWVGIAGRTSGDGSLKNMAAYITNKFTEFTQNELVRLVVGQSKSSINFREIMDRKRILLINLSKGLLSEADSMFLGMVLTGRMFAAAMTRASMAPSRRVPFHIYIDEFQNFTSSSIGAILAEARKYGLSLTLAHQNVGQLPDDMAQSVLANTGSKIFMRLGSQDAGALSQYVAPTFTAHDLVSLPDHYAVARLKINNVPSPAFVMRTRFDGTAKTIANMSVVDDIVRRSRERYCVEVGLVRHRIEARRHTHLMRMTVAAAGLSDDLCKALQADGVRTVKEILAWPAEKRAQLISLSQTLQDRSTVQRILNLGKMVGDDAFAS